MRKDSDELRRLVLSVGYKEGKSEQKVNEYIRQYCKNKSVALVGCADYLELLDEDNLKRIEECDIVVKMNKGFNLSKTHAHLISSRIDIYYNSLLEDCVNGGVLDIEEIGNSEIALIRTTPQSDMKGIATEYRTNTASQATIDKIHKLREKYGITTTLIPPEFFTGLSRTIDCKPTTGFAAIFDLVSFQPASIYVTGFSFFLGGPIKGYWGGDTAGGIEETWDRTEEQHAEKCFNSTRHVHSNMWRVFKDFHTISGNISLDPIMKEIISLENYSRDGYNKIVSEYKNEKSDKS